MEIRRHPQCNLDIGAPSDMTDDECSSLPVITYQNPQGRWAASFWRPSEEELSILNAGGSIILHVRADGRQHPVVAMNVTADATESL